MIFNVKYKEMIKPQIQSPTEDVLQIYNVVCKKMICNRILYQVKNIAVVIHTFDVIELFILPFDYGLSFLNFPWSLVFL